MSGSYRQCVECGKRALRFATRCPGCGIELPSPAPLEDNGTRQLSWSDSFKGVMAVLVLGVAIASLDHVPTGPAPLSAETRFVKPLIHEKPAVADTTTLAAPPAPTAGVLLIAKGWTYVRSRRTVNATLEAVLTPGDSVVADSLTNGWYRVALYGEVLGYARQSTLAPTPGVDSSRPRAAARPVNGLRRRGGPTPAPPHPDSSSDRPTPR